MRFGRRWRGVLYGGLATGAVIGAVALALHYTSWSGDQALGIAWPLPTTGCIDPDKDGGAPVANLDATTEAGSPLWLATISGNATAAPLAVQIFGDDVGNQIDSFNVAAPGAWSRDLVLNHGWNKLIFRVTYKGQSVETVRWLGFDNDPPSATAVWSEPDGGCADAGCAPPIGNINRCFGVKIVCQTPCPDAGCLCQAADVDAGPRTEECEPCPASMGCLRACGRNGLNCCDVDAGLYYRFDAGACRRRGDRFGLTANLNLRGLTDPGCGIKGWELHVRRWPRHDAGSYDAALAGRVTIRKYWCRAWAGGWHGPTITAFDAGGSEVKCEGNACCAVFYSSE